VCSLYGFWRRVWTARVGPEVGTLPALGFEGSPTVSRRPGCPTGKLCKLSLSR
jgi:hypothetical protein